MPDNCNANGPIVAWLDYGPEGWQPRSYATIHEALLDDRYQKMVLTRIVEFEVIEKDKPDV